MYAPEFTKSGSAKHSSGCTAAFGRKDMNCHRCVELANGAPSRAGWQQEHFTSKARREEQRRREIAAHFAPGGPHALGKCSALWQSIASLRK